MNNQPAEKISYNVPSLEFKEHTFENGLRLVMSRSDNIPMVSINTMFHIGSKDEEEGKSGLAHLFEHLMFEGSPNISKGKFDEILNQNGGDSNAYTTWDNTSYYLTLPSSHLELGLWLDSDRLSGFAIGEESLEIQKDVVLEEKLLYVDNSPYGSVEEESSKRLFTYSGYRRPIIGSMDDLKKVTVGDLKDFFNRHYVPNNAVISIVGDIDYDKTIRLVEKYYGGIPSGNIIQRKKIAEKDISGEIIHEMQDNIQLEGKFIFYRVPEAGTKDFYALNILNGILSEGESSRFFMELEYKNELVSECESNLYAMEHEGIFCINALAMKGKSLKEIGNKIDDIIENIKNGNISDGEMTKVKNKIESYYNSKRQSIVSLSDKFSYFKTFFGDCSKINFEIIDFLSVTKEDVIRSASKYLNQNQRVVLNYYPKKN